MLPSFLSIRAAWVAAFAIIAVAASILAAQRASALGQERYVQFSAAPGSFTIVNANTTATIYVDPKDWPGVLRAANDLANDIKDVTGKKPGVVSSAKVTARAVIIIGTVGKSQIINQLVAAHKIYVSAIRGKWESYFMQVVRKPLPGVDSALVICGSDKRGSIYGIYDLSEESGQSPWYYWADVPAKKHAELHVKAGKFSGGEPSVKYRGIFFNDEAPSLSGYIHANTVISRRTMTLPRGPSYPPVLPITVTNSTPTSSNCCFGAKGITFGPPCGITRSTKMTRRTQQSPICMASSWAPATRSPCFAPRRNGTACPAS